MDVARLALTGAAGVAAGFVNAVAGGGSLISFPALVAAGLPALQANVTNTIALSPGYLGGAFAQRRDLARQRRRVALLLPASAIGGALGALLLLATGEATFEIVIPFLLTFAVALLALQDRLRAWFVKEEGKEPKRARREALIIVPVAIAAVYGGYFGAALSVIVLASLAVILDDSLTRLNALKQLVSLGVNTSAAIVFLARARIDWTVALVLAVGALIGGAIGGSVASRVPATLLRRIVILAGIGLAAYYFAKLV